MSPLVATIIVSLVAMTIAIPGMDRVIKDYHGREYLDPKENYLLEWTIDWANRMMLFNITVNTNGWVGFGFSKDGLMKDADMVIAGVTPQKRSYITDFHTDCHRTLKADNSQDWNLLGAGEVSGRTSVSLSRLIDTCDSQDYPVTEDLVYLIWAFGDTDNVDYHHQTRGLYKIYLLDPVVHPALSSNSLPKWRATKHFTLPARRTSYWCSIHKAPPSPYRRKHHFIEFRAVLDKPRDVAVNHVHHFVLWRCFAPPGVNPRVIFEALVAYEGEECYFSEHNIIPINMCRTMTYVWAVGGRPLILPDHVGIPFAESPDEYYMLETHYNNPEEIAGITFESGVEGTYTERLRPQDGGAFMINYDFFGFFMIPPGTLQFQMYSQCSKECTATMFPPGGVDVFAIHSHSHTSGRKMKLHHFRNGKELPWIIKDDNYDWQFQTPRPLHTERKLLPGDHLTIDCIYSDTWTNVTTFAGFSGIDEMCLQVLYHTIPIPHSWCTGTIPEENLLHFLGVQNVTWDLPTQERIVTSPLVLRGNRLAHVADDLTSWSKALRDTVASTTIGSPQVVTCPITTILVEPQDESKLGYAKHQLLGTYVPPSVTMPTGSIISGYPLVDTQFSRTRSCAAH